MNNNTPQEGGIINNYVLEYIIEETNYSTVFAARKSTEKQTKYVIKVLHPFSNIGSKEVQILEKIRCSNIIELIDVFQYNSSRCLMFPLCIHCDLLEILSRKGSKLFSESFLKTIAIGVLKGLEYLHDMNIVHRDIKPENIVIMKKKPMIDDVKLIDFGFVKQIPKGEKVRDQVGSELYSAPQVLNGEEYSTECDIWSLGITLYYLALKKFPFDPTNRYEYRKMILNPLSIIDYGEMNKYFPRITMIIMKMLIHNPNDRITAREALDDFFSSN